MPWSANESKGHTRKANTPKKKSKWAAIANGILKESGDEGKAIRIANASVDARFWKGNIFLDKKFEIYVRTLKDEDEDMNDGKDCPDCGGTGKDGDDDCPTCGGSGEYDEGEDMNSDALHDARPRTTIRMYDRVEIDDAAQVRQLVNGYVAAMPRIARTGIQVYHGDECGRDDMDRVRVYRPESEVFHKDAAHTYTHLPLTLDHPTELVDSSNWKKYAVGETGDEVLRDGTAIRVPMMLRDAKAIKAFRDGTNQLSVGYDCDLEWIDGVTDDGEHYDAIQHGIRANHLAVVAAARGGSTLTIGDDNPRFERSNTMNLKTILVDGLEVQVMDSAATVIQRTISALEAKYQTLHDKFKKKEEEDEDDEEEFKKKDDAIKARDETIKVKDKEIETKAGEIAALKTQLDEANKKASPQAIDSAARERASVIDKANTIMGSRLKTDGMTVSDIRRAVVDARVGNCKNWSDDRVEGAFDAMQTNAFSQDRRNGPQNTIEDAVRVFGRPGIGYQSPAEARDKAYSDYDSGISEAWRGKQAS